MEEKRSAPPRPFTFEGVHFRAVFREYQRRVLAGTERHLSDGRVHIVAAPGSGKTVLGLELIRRLGGPALVLSPSVAIRQQWGQRFSEFFLPMGRRESEYISCDPRAPALITSITYQTLHAALRRLKGEAAREEAGERQDAEGAEDGETSDFSGFQLLPVLRAAGIRTLCLDEAHHLRNEWQRSLEALIEELAGEMTVIALTATPPYDGSPAEWQRYTALCGEIDEEIFVPQLVAQGTLCPHQDYVYLSYPTQSEAEKLTEHRRRAQRCTEALLGGTLIEDALHSSTFLADPHAHLDEVLAQEHGVKALLCLARHKGMMLDKRLIRLIVPRGALPVFTFETAQVAFQFILDHPEWFRAEVAEGLRAALAQNALLERNQVRLFSTERIDRALISSSGKLDSIVRIAAAERAAMGENLRLVVLTDHIRREWLSAIGTDRPLSMLGVTPVFEALRRALGEEARIGALSGGLVVLPRAAVRMAREIAEGCGVGFTEKPIGSVGYSEILFAGSNKDKTAVISEVFRRGGVRMLVGTQALLGEGWDAPCVNALILASYVGSFVSSNQMRGRAIRVCGDVPGKTANIWHLATIDAQAVGPWAGGDGSTSKDYELLVRRFQCFLAPAYRTPEITDGIGRIDILQPPFTVRGIEEINAQMLELAADRPGMAALWQQSFEGSEHPEVLKISRVPKAVQPVRLFQKFLGASTLGLTGLSASGAAAFSLFRAGNFSAALIAAGAALICGSIAARGFRHGLRFMTPERTLRTLGESLLCALQAMKRIESKDARVRVALARDGGWMHCSLEGGSLREKSLFAQTVRELLSPIDAPRYLLIRKAGKRYDYAQSYACPSAIGEHRKDAAVLSREIEKRAGGMALVYARNEAGRKELLRCRRNSYVNRKKICIEERQAVKS